MGLANLYYGSLVEFRNAHKGLKFDLIYSNHVFEHVNNPHEYLTNCREMLGENGSIICAVPDIYNSHTHIFPNSNFKPMFHIAHIYNYSMFCLENMAEKLGMQIQRLEPDPQSVLQHPICLSYGSKCKRTDSAIRLLVLRKAIT